MATTNSPSDSSGQGDASEGSLLDSQGLEQLLKQARNGSRDALNELIRSMQGYLLLVANEELDAGLRAKVGASDLVQSALAQAEQNLGQFRGDSFKTLLAWIRTILFNEVNATRRKYLQTEKRNSRREVNAIADSQIELPVADTRPSPRTEALLHEESRALRDALARLPDHYRMVVVLRNWERLPFDKIGQRMDRSTAAVKKLWRRALRHLQKELNSESPREQT